MRKISLPLWAETKCDRAKVKLNPTSSRFLRGLSANVPSYCLSKLALNGATIMLADALCSKRIVVNAVCPGWLRTDMGGAS